MFIARPKSGPAQWLARGARLLAALLAIACMAGRAQAQHYNNSTSGVITDLTCGTGNELVRTFSVGANVIVSDVNIGVALQHTFRADLIITLTSPQGTTVSLMNAQGGTGANLSDLFDDSATVPIASHNSSSADPSNHVPPYFHSFRPNAALGTFNGQLSAGTWTLTICDGTALDSGTFTRSDLYITGTTLADLSLGMTVSDSLPIRTGTVTYTLTASSAASSSATASGVTVHDILPSGLGFASYSGTGTYNSSTGVWTVGNLAPGSSASITITASVAGSPGTTIVNSAQITASSQPDPDSTVSNGVTSEDDYAASTITVASPQLSVSKALTILADPANAGTNPKATPGATVRYCVSITNTGNIAASTIALSDSLPTNASLVAGTLRSGTSCAAAATTEDDNATGTDESDPFGAAASGNTVSGSTASLGVGSSFVLTYTVTIN